MQEKEFKDLLNRYAAGECSDQEKAFLESWYLHLGNKGNSPSADEIEKAYMEVKSSVPLETSGKTINLRRLAAAAAAVFIVVSAATLYFGGRETPVINKFAETKPVEKGNTNDKLPGGNRAVLTLSDGSAIILDDAQRGELAQQGSTEINKTAQGVLVYESSTASASPKKLLYNSIKTPRGGQYQVTLPDGTKVWLNAASSLRFPTEFTGSSRQVELSGEAYFEVAENKSKPFLVNVNQSQVEVLGTHFNVMAYSDEILTTTLLEGSVKFKHGLAEKTIKPGQAARLGKRIRVSEVNTDDAVAWKNGVTAFSNADIYSIMRQISRWYDIDVEYRGQLPDRKFTGKIPRSSPMSKVLKVLELSDINFKVYENKILVTP